MGQERCTFYFSPMRCARFRRKKQDGTHPAAPGPGVADGGFPPDDGAELTVPKIYCRQESSCSGVRLFSRVISCLQAAVGVGHVHDDRQPAVVRVAELHFDRRLGRQVRRQVADHAFAHLRAIVRRGAFPFDDLHQDRIAARWFACLENALGGHRQRRVAGMTIALRLRPVLPSVATTPRLCELTLRI